MLRKICTHLCEEGEPIAAIFLLFHLYFNIIIIINNNIIVVVAKAQQNAFVICDAFDPFGRVLI